MIRTECAVFAAMLVAGVASRGIGSFLFTLGKASPVARAVFDFLTPLAVGAIFFFTLARFADGVFRVYALLAFALGWGVGKALCAKLSPAFRRAAKRIILPIKSLESSLERRLEARLAPYRERRRLKKAARREKWVAIREMRAEKRKQECRRREKRREEKRAKREEGSLLRKEKGNGARSRRSRGREVTVGVPFGQSD